MLAGATLSLKSDATLSRKGPWFVIFREEKPKGTVPWLHVRMDDETDVWGYLRSYSDPTKSDAGTLVLGGTTLKWRRKDAQASSLFGDLWDAIWSPVERITTFALSTETKRLTGGLAERRRIDLKGSSATSVRCARSTTSRRATKPIRSDNHVGETKGRSALHARNF